MTAQNKTFIIAEAGVNHNGSMETAFELIRAAAEAGADAVKFQSFKADSLVSKSAVKAEYQNRNTGVDETQYAMLKRLELDESAHLELAMQCEKVGIRFLSSPFDVHSLDMLVNRLQLSVIKIPSGEITNAPLLLKAGQSGLPVILSSGVCTLADIEMALGILAFGYLGAEETPSPAAFMAAYASSEGQRLLKQNVSLLHCTTEYPAPLAEVNLRVMDTLASAYGLPVGFSDHTVGISIPIAAVARGATIVEKHFTLDKSFPGPDHKASLEPHELRAMVESIRQVELALGSPLKAPSPSESKNRSIIRKSLVASREIQEGELFTERNVGIKRPGGGIDPIHYWGFIGKRATRSYATDEWLT